MHEGAVFNMKIMVGRYHSQHIIEVVAGWQFEWP